MKTKHLRLVTYEHSVTMGNRESVPSPFGPVRAGLTTSQITQDQQLTELLNCLENVVASLNYKSFEVYDTLNIAIEAVSVALNSTQTELAGTDETT